MTEAIEVPERNVTGWLTGLNIWISRLIERHGSKEDRLIYEEIFGELMSEKGDRVEKDAEAFLQVVSTQSKRQSLGQKKPQARSNLILLE